MMTITTEQIEERIRELGPWFHNIDLGGVKTAPGHFLGDYPALKWKMFQHAVPQDLRGKSVLDVGCNAGYYSQEMKRRGAARVLGIDWDERYLAQARFAAEVAGLDIEYRQLSVYDAGAIGEKFDVVLFLGVLYHLRHPLLALDLLHDHVCRDLLVFQSLMRGNAELGEFENDYTFGETAVFGDPRFPRMYFIEHEYSHDYTNWWIPNRACAEAMLRDSGFEILEHPENEVFIARRVEIHRPEPNPVYPARGRRRR